MPRMTPQDDARAAELISQGLSYRQAAVKLGATDKTVKAAVERHRAHRRAHSKPSLRDRLLTMTAKELQRVRKDLDQRERMIFDNRLASEKPLTLQQLAVGLEVTRQRAHQLEADLLERLSDVA